VSKRRKKKSTKSYFVVRAIISLISVYILVSIIYPLISPKSKVPCANSLSCKESLKLKVENNALGVFNNHQVVPPYISLSEESVKPVVLGAETTSGEKRIYVDLATQTLTAYEGKKLFMKTFIASGKWNRTPKGKFTVWVKLRATRMSGGSGADYYDLPNVPYVMFFGNDETPNSAGFSLHGTYWHNNFGHPMSHGCVNMRTIDAEKIYNWVNPITESNTTYSSSKNPGVKIKIYGDAPI